MASQTRVIACGTRKAVLAMAMKFLVGPLIMAVPSLSLGLRGTLLKVAIVQVRIIASSHISNSVPDAFFNVKT